MSKIFLKDKYIDTKVTAYLMSLYLDKDFEGYADVHDETVSVLVSKDGVEILNKDFTKSNPYVSLSKVIHNRYKVGDDEFINRVDKILTSNITTKEDIALFDFLNSVDTPLLIHKASDKDFVFYLYSAKVFSIIKDLNENSYKYNKDSKVLLVNRDPYISDLYYIETKYPIVITYKYIQSDLVLLGINCTTELVDKVSNIVGKEYKIGEFNYFNLIINKDKFTSILSMLDRA
jgi:hypothetical protein